MELWVEKYRPQSLAGYVFQNEDQKTLVERWAREGIPHILLEGGPGMGKTTLAYVLLNELTVDPGDILFINASRERKIEDVQDRIINFVSTWPIGEYRYIILDEGDSLTPLAQRVLRGEIERFSDTARFIITANYANKIIPALHSRFQTLTFSSLDREEFTLRVGEILMKEGVEFDIPSLTYFIDVTYPDLRKCIGLVQQQSHSGVLKIPEGRVSNTKDYLLDVVNLFQAGKTREARLALIAAAQPEEYPDIYRYLYDNLHLFTDDVDKQEEMILIIARGLREHVTATVADPEINLSAIMVELSNLFK